MAGIHHPVGVKTFFIKYRTKMKRLFLIAAVAFLATMNLWAQQKTVQPYIPAQDLPDLIKCLPAPPAFDSPEFAYDVVRYQWGKTQRADSARAAIARRDAVWTYEALLLAEINPARADTIFARGWMYGESRVIEGAHWQSDVDASRVAASIGYSALQTSPAFREQMERAKAEFARKTGN